MTSYELLGMDGRAPLRSCFSRIHAISLASSGSLTCVVNCRTIGCLREISTSTAVNKIDNTLHTSLAWDRGSHPRRCRDYLLAHARASDCRTNPGLHAALLLGHRSHTDAQPKHRLAFILADCWGVETEDPDESTREMRRCPVEPATVTCLEHNEQVGTRPLVLFA